MGFAPNRGNNRTRPCRIMDCRREPFVAVALPLLYISTLVWPPDIAKGTRRRCLCSIIAPDEALGRVRIYYCHLTCLPSARRSQQQERSNSIVRALLLVLAAPRKEVI